MSDISIHSHVHSHIDFSAVDTPAELAHSEKMPEHDVPKDSVEKHDGDTFTKLTRNTANDPITLDPPDNLLDSNITIGSYVLTTGNATEKQTIQQGVNQTTNSNNFAKLSLSLFDRGVTGQVALSEFCHDGQ